jgi:hypothetical protein
MGAEGDLVGGVLIDRVDQMACRKCGTGLDVSGSAPFDKVVCPSCATEQSVPARLGSFLLLRHLGTGGMGAVYHAKDETLGRAVAIKVMQSSVGEDSDFVETFKREAQAAAKLNHPNVAQIYSFGQEKGQPYIVMELVPGSGLDKMIESGEPLDQGLVMKVASEIAGGLSVAAEIGLVHGDIKPENILLDEKMNAKLVDFGIAQFAHQSSDGIWGTPYYIAPEKIRRQKIDARSDIYSLGATLYHALTGVPPFEGETPVEVVKARLERSPVPLREIRPDLDERVEAIIMRMLQLEPGMRYPNYVSLINDINKALEVLAPPKSVGGRGKRVVIKKKGGKSTIAAPLSGARPGGKLEVRRGAGVTPPSGVMKAPGAAAGGAEAAEGTGGGRKALKVVLILLLVLMLVGGVTGGGIWFKISRDREIERRKEAYALQSAQAEARDVLAEVLGVVTSVAAMGESTAGMIDRATNEVFIVLGEVFEIPAEPIPEPEVEPAAEPDAAASTNVTDDAVSNAAPGDAAAPAAEAEAEAGVEESAPGGDAEAVAGEDEVRAPAAVVIEPELPEEEPEIKQLARRVVAAVRAVLLQADLAADVEAKARDIAKQAEEAGDSVVAVGRVSLLKGHLEDVKQHERDARAALGDATKALERAAEIRVRSEKLREERRQRELREAREREEREAREREERERAERVELEQATIRTMREQYLPMIRQNEFRKAAHEVRMRLGDFRTEEGKAGVQTLLERYERLERMRQYLIQRLEADPFQWGWVMGASPIDIQGANEIHIKVRGGFKTWKEAGPRQMLKFFQRYLVSRDVKLVDLADQNLAAAIYCFENGGLDLALEYKRKAVDYNPNIREDADRLVPME